MSDRLLGKLIGGADDFRIVSFLILGAVLLLLGFVYNRFAETIRRWL